MISAWFGVNILLLNPKKTKCVDKFITLINSSYSLDYQLKWGPHVNAIANRLSSAAFAVRNIWQLTDMWRRHGWSILRTLIAWFLTFYENLLQIKSQFYTTKEGHQSNIEFKDARITEVCWLYLIHTNATRLKYGINSSVDTKSFQAGD